MKIIAKLRIKTYIKNETNNGKTTVYTFSRKLKTINPNREGQKKSSSFYWKNKENTICHANDYTIRRGISYKTGI